MKSIQIIITITATAFLFSWCQKEQIGINLEPSDIISIGLKDSSPEVIKTDSGQTSIIAIGLDPRKYPDFLKDIKNAKNLGLKKLPLCYSIYISTEDKGEIILWGRGNLITVGGNDKFYQLDVDLIQKYWSIHEAEVCDSKFIEP